MKKFVISLQILILVSLARGFASDYQNSSPLSDGAVGSPRFLSPLIENGKIDEARIRATVEHKEMNNVNSYAGYLTVNKAYNSNMFFWFFPSARNPNTDPIILWLQGGPGASSIFGLFMESGPFFVTANKTLVRNIYSWTKSHNLLYIDNPVGTGYSFTEDERGYANTETDVGRDLCTALVQFFQLFPEYQSNEFFVAGASYAGKFALAVSHAVKDYNVKARRKINLKGLAIGSGLIDPGNQLARSDYLYPLGVIDMNGRNLLYQYEEKTRMLIEQQKYTEAFDELNSLLSGQNGSPSLFANLTGFEFSLNIVKLNQTDESEYVAEWIQRADVRKAIHVGNRTFDITATKVQEHLKADHMQSMATLLSDLIQRYRILIYSGQLDMIIPYITTLNYLQKLRWPGAEKYKTAERMKWYVDNELAGYSKIVDNLTEVLVRNAGHLIPYDQPKWSLDLITRFTRNKGF